MKDDKSIVFVDVKKVIGDDVVDWLATGIACGFDLGP